MKAVALGRRWCSSGAPAHDVARPIELIEQLLFRDCERVIETTVREVQRVIDEGADLVCLPGSSLPTTKGGPSRLLLDLSKRATLVLETVADDGSASNRTRKGLSRARRQGWVLAGGAVRCGPVAQLFVDSSELGSRRRRADKLTKLADEIANDARTFPLPGGYLGPLLICGEINAIRSTGPAAATWTPEAWRGEVGSDAVARWWAAHDQVVVCNPTHTWMRPAAVWPKRRFLAAKGAYLGPTNGYAFDGWSASNIAGSICERQSEPRRIVIGPAEAALATYPPLVWRDETVDLRADLTTTGVAEGRHAC